jgi:hypothetical protein
MADVSTYKVCTMPYAVSGAVCNVGDLRQGVDPVVTANPQWWTTLADADFTKTTVLELLED